MTYEAGDFVEAVTRWNCGRSTGPVEIPYEYLLAIARKRDA